MHNDVKRRYLAFSSQGEEFPCFISNKRSSLRKTENASLIVVEGGMDLRPLPGVSDAEADTNVCFYNSKFLPFWQIVLVRFRATLSGSCCNTICKQRLSALY